MALNPRDRNTLTTHLGTATNLAYIVGSLSAGRGKLMPVKYANFEEIKWWLKSMLLITTDDAGVREAADLIQQLSTARPALVIETAPPPPLDVAKEKKKITDDCAHAATIRTVYVQLDVDQNGTLSKTEAASLKGLSKDFDKADANGDGALTTDEYKTYLAAGGKSHAHQG